MSEMVERVVRALQQFPLALPRDAMFARPLEKATAEKMARAATKAIRDFLEEEAKAIPVGTADKQVGSSAYNHAMVAVRRINAALEEPEE